MNIFFMNNINEYNTTIFTKQVVFMVDSRYNSFTPFTPNSLQLTIQKKKIFFITRIPVKFLNPKT